MLVVPSLSAGLPTLVQVSEHTARYVEASLQGATNTVLAYANDLKRFGAWCTTHELELLPASVDTLAGFVTHLAETGKKIATIQRHCAAISKVHALQGIDLLTNYPRTTSSAAQGHLTETDPNIFAGVVKAPGQKLYYSPLDCPVFGQ